jgi:DNA-directed RNA polymerase subunit L
MEISVNVIEDDGKSFVAEFVGADRSLPDLIRSKVAESKEVEFASVEKDHPEIGNPRLVVKASRNAKGHVLKAIEELEEQLKELSAELPKK